MKSKRIQWLDFGKGFTIFLVVLFHCTQFCFPHSMLFLRNFLEVFMMPVFFAISGYLYKPVYTKRDYNILIYKKASSFVLPYSIFAIILFVLNKYRFLLGTSWAMPQSISIYFPFIHGAYLWFLLVLFMVFLFVGSINYFYKSHVLINKIIMIVFIILILFVSKHTDGLIAFTYWLICFVIGYLIKYFHLYQYRKLMHKFVFMYFILWLVLVIIQFHYEPTIEYKTGSNPISMYSLMPSFLSILLFFMIFILFNNRKVIFKYFCKYGRYTLVIYLIHFPILILIGHYLSVIKISRYLLWIIVVMIIWIISTISCKALQLPTFNFIFYPRKYITRYIMENKK